MLNRAVDVCLAESSKTPALKECFIDKQKKIKKIKKAIDK